jgi:hypothetical protein
MAQSGGQKVFLDCPLTEVLGHGNRGGGKTDALIMSFDQGIGQGWGPEYRGVIFRKTYKQLRDVVAKSRRLFRMKYGMAASFNSQEMTWTFPDGEQLLLSYMRTEADYDNHHGFGYCFIGFEELTSWASPTPYTRMFSCLRSSNRAIPLRIRATTNPYGVGHNWVKARFRLPSWDCRAIVPGEEERDPETGSMPPARMAVQIDLQDNKALIESNPNYLGLVLSAARNPSERKAWASGAWDIVAGGMFDDLWDPRRHVLPDFPVSAVPRGWKWRRGYDHGSSRPFSYGVYLESDGTPLEWEGRRIGEVRGDVIRFAELYGWQKGHRNEGLKLTAIEVGRRLRAFEQELGVHGRVRPGPADTAIFSDYDPGKSVAGDIRRSGIRFTSADKERKQGWEQCRTMLEGALPVEGVGRERPGFFVCARCDQFVELIPTAPRDDDDLDDVDTEWEDHIADEWRYFLRRKVAVVRGGRVKGV